MNNSEMLAIFDKEVRRECEWTRMRRDVLPHLVRYVLTDVGHGGGFISWSHLTSDNADAAIREQMDYFKALNTDFEWKLYSYDQPSDMAERLLAHGFVIDRPDALMVADINDLPEEYWTMDVSDVQPVTTAEGVDEIVRMESEVWSEDVTGFARGMKHDLVHHPENLSVFAVWQDGRIVSAAWTHYLLSTSFRFPVGWIRPLCSTANAASTLNWLPCARAKPVNVDSVFYRWMPVPKVSRSLPDTDLDVWLIQLPMNGNRIKTGIWPHFYGIPI